MATLSEADRRRGLEGIRKTRQVIAAARHPVNPFRHNPDGHCLICAGPCEAVPVPRSA